MNNQAIVVKNKVRVPVEMHVFHIDSKENMNKISEFSSFVCESVEYELRTEIIYHETQQYSKIS